MLDNVDALVGTERAQEELFHLFDALQRSGAQLVFAARVAPRELVGIEDRLRSRLESGLVVELPSSTRNSRKCRPAAAEHSELEAPEGGVVCKVVGCR